MVSSVNDSLKQAYQGSVSAIIQVLNDRLSAQGIRTRAIFESGVLQVLCEAAKPEDLAQEALVGKIRSTLEDISPRNIRRVNINARIIQEQQLLWLDEIKKDPENQLLWSEEILLARPHLMKHFFEGLKINSAEKAGIPAYAPSSPTARKQREKQQFNKGLLGGLLGAGVLGLAGFGIYKLMPLGADEIDQHSPASLPATATKNATAKNKAVMASTSDDFAAAVRLAGEAAGASQTAKTKAEWSAIAEKWGKASELMAKVPPSDARYEKASDRTTSYRNNQQIALKKAQ
jgi:hypothetical protein